MARDKTKRKARARLWRTLLVALRCFHFIQEGMGRQRSFKLGCDMLIF